MATLVHAMQQLSEQLIHHTFKYTETLEADITTSGEAKHIVLQLYMGAVLRL